MKKLIVTVCTLALTFLGVTGINQNSLNVENELNTNINREAIEQIVTDVEVQEITSEDVEAQEITSIENEATVSGNEQKDMVIEQKEETPAQVNKKAPAKQAVANVTQAPAKQAVANVAQAPAKQAVANVAQPPAKQAVANVAQAPAKQAVANVAQAPAKQAVANVTQAPAKEIVTNNTPVQSNGQAQVVKNIDFSQCNSTEDIIAVLQKNGFSNVNSNNIQNIISIDQIRNIIQNNATSNNNTVVNRQQAPTNNTTTVNRQQAPTNNTTTVNRQQAPTNNTTTVNRQQAPTNNAPTNNTPTNNAPATTTTNSGIGSYANQVLQLVNQERAKAGLSALTSTPELQAAATKRAQETVQNFSHTRPNGTQWSTVLKEYNVPNMRSGENIAMGQRTPQEVVTGWMNSPGHRANIMNGSFGKLGVGVYESNGRLYWAQLFTN